MQILFLTHRLPYPPDKGERIRAYEELRYLAARHDVDLFCLADSDDSEHEQVCRQMCRDVYVQVMNNTARLMQGVWCGFRGKSISAGFFYSKKFARAVQRALQSRRYDVVFVYCSSMGQYIPSSANVPVTVDFVDADSAKWQQYAKICKPPLSWVYAREGRAIAACEQNLGRRAALSLAVTEHDARELGGAGRPFDVTVMPNGVSVPSITPELSDDGESREQPYAVFVGTMDYRPNADAAEYFAKDIFPLVRRRYPELKFVIVGRNPKNRVRQLTSLPGVTVTGSVPDVYRYFRQAEISVAPFRISQGFHNKIAESLAVGTPVVTTPRAAAGVQLSERDGLFTANHPEQFAEVVCKVLGDTSLRSRLREAAPALRKRLSWEGHLREMEELMLGVANKDQSYQPSLQES